MREDTDRSDLRKLHSAVKIMDTILEAGEPSDDIFWETLELELGNIEKFINKIEK